VRLLSKEYVVLVAVAFAVGSPVAYLGVRQWLQDFAYRIEVGPGPFLATGGLALVVGGLSVSVHALRAARTDPARALRSE
jgi:putative ABC transport system permease protein